MSKYEHVVYGVGFKLKVNPPDRGMDVMHYLITGHLLGGRSLDNVTWVETEHSATVPLTMHTDSHD